jgi:RND family efflux transporter MFP subunit
MGTNNRLSSPRAAAFALALAAGLSPLLAARAAEVPLIEVKAVAGGGAGLSFSKATSNPCARPRCRHSWAGNVLSLLVKAGDRVKAGQAIARIDDRDAQAGLQRTAAGLSQAEAEARNARVAAERARDLRAQGFVSQAALDTAETQYKAAQAGVQQAQAAQAQAGLARGFASVTAPFDGVVLATHLEAGDLASPGRAIATLYAPGGLRATTQVPLSQAEAARRATRIDIELPDGRRVQPARKAELASADPVSQTVEWRLDLPASALPGLMPGQVARVHFSGAAAPAAAAGAPSTLRLPPPRCCGAAS